MDMNNKVSVLMKKLSEKTLRHHISFDLNEKMNDRLNKYAQKQGISKDQAAKDLVIDGLIRLEKEYEVQIWE